MEVVIVNVNTLQEICVLVTDDQDDVQKMCDDLAVMFKNCDLLGFEVRE